MASLPKTPIPAVLLALVIALFPPATRSDDTCPYPCYPPPTGSGTTTPATLSPPSQTGYSSYSPPAYYSPPAAYYPYNPPTSDGNSFDGVTPPPPDPILPYFPYYYKKPPHKPDDESGGSAVAGRKSEVGLLAGTFVLIALSLFSFILM
ncbi:leucine-rich repeat extensin-like protein 5 [Cucumis sativus]|uniref:Hydroxyproline-rich glycoprotein n=1 Tax=Cucumis sativus TaxID=3659 RepID=A0A0A0KUZ1_CUCSA|nr:leucine-rich repeat extensin-like protein 5 [Cucumis sativus]